MLRWLLVLLVFCGLTLAGKDDFVSPEKSAERMTVPEGFRVQLVAGEPTLIKPIAMATDERGRLWVVESHSYPHWLTSSKATGKDRVLILEPDATGKWSCKVFLENGVNLSGITLGHGGVWLTSVPRLIFIPRKAGEDRPGGPEQVLLDGWDLKAKHNVVNALCWGPDGWLYGCNGILSRSRVGAPGTPDAKRTPMECGVWRYHPTRKTFEVYAHGTTNPWGIDWDEHGELFLTNCVIKHVFHAVPGARFERMYGQDLHPHSYELMQSCADHIHWGGGNWTSSRGGQGVHSTAGGGHAHAGAMFYLGDNWPVQYRNRLLMANLHGNRLNQDRIERKGSTYVARHCEDFLLANDPWFRGLGQVLGADGGMFVSDWHDTGECHNYDKTHPSGRIYRVTFGSPQPVRTNLDELKDEELVKLHLHANDWWVRQSRLILAQRAAIGKLSPEVGASLWRLIGDQKEVPHKLAGLWGAHAVGYLNPRRLIDILERPEEPLRVWAVRLLVDGPEVAPESLSSLVKQARKDTSPAVRLALASALQRLPLLQRWELASALCAHAEDAGDPCIPLMIWYGIEPAVAADPDSAARLLVTANLPLIRRFIARRLAAMVE